MSNVSGDVLEARENDEGFVAAMLAAEVASANARPTVGMLSPRKHVREKKADEAGPSSYLNEID